MAHPAPRGRLALANLATILFCTVSQIILFGTVSHAGFTYPFSFFNISTDKQDVGFVQVFACSAGQANIYFQTPAANGLSQFAALTANDTFNLTLGFQTAFVGAPTNDLASSFPNGVLVSSDLEVYLYAVKADVGTTDGYMVYPLTNNSVEFYIAGWMVSAPEFYTGVSITTAYDDTCISLWEVINGQYVRKSTVYVPSRMTNVERLKNDVLFDTTVFYINSSKPITVTVGTSCGRVNVSTPFCDHMAEVVPPLNELGVRYIVPPILNRTASAGFLVRVVGTVPKTTVTWTDYGGTTTNMGLVGPTQWVDVKTNDASTPIQVDCSAKCLVMLYNRGKNAVSNEKSYTDPFTMTIAPIDHFANFSCFATASFCYNRQLRQDFFNWVAIVTATGNINNILLDGAPLRSPILHNFNNYVVATVYVEPGFHSVSAGPLSTAPFGAYAYGHSRFYDSSSAYGYPIVYKMSGIPVDSTWSAASQTRQQLTASARAATCLKPAIVNGSFVVNYVNPTNPTAPWTLPNYITLDAYVRQDSPVALSPACVDAYTKVFRNLMSSAFSAINYLLCTQSICTSLVGTGSGAIVSTGNVVTGLLPISMFVAVDTTTLENRITFDTQPISGSSNVTLTGVHIAVPYIGVLDTNAASFGQCKAEIRNFLVPFVNWLSLGNNGLNPNSFDQIASLSSAANALQKQLIADNSIVTSPQGCPPIKFNQPAFTYSPCSVRA